MKQQSAESRGPIANPPLVSIITPSLNQGPFIKATIQSVLEQDYSNIEYLVMDGGSTDQTLDILRSYGDRLQWVSEPDRGQTDAVNRGIRRTRGEIIGWLNSDDLYAPGAISAAINAFSANPDLMLVYGDAYWIAGDGRKIAPCISVEPFNLNRLLFYANFIVQPAAFFRRTAVETVGGLDDSLNYVMDYDLWIRLTKRYRAAYIDQVLALVRDYPETKTSTGGSQRMREMAQMINRHGGRGLPAYYRLEQMGMLATEALVALGRMQVGQSLSCAVRACEGLLAARVVRTLLSPRTWQIIRTRRLRSG